MSSRVAEKILDHMRAHGEQTFTGKQLAEELKLKAITTYMWKLAQAGAIRKIDRDGNGIVYQFHHTPRRLDIFANDHQTNRRPVEHRKPRKVKVEQAPSGTVANGHASVKLAITVGGFDISMTFAEANELFKQLQSLFNIEAPR